MEYKSQISQYQEYKLFHCPECGTIFKCLLHSIDGCIELYTTDFGDIIPLNDISQGFIICCVWICPKCGQLIASKPIDCEDWVVDKLFKVKGDTL